jgi:hypothetical protein
VTRLSTRPRRRKRREGARARLQANIKQTEERVVEKTRNFVDEEISKLTLQIMKLTREHAQVRSSARPHPARSALRPAGGVGHDSPSPS